MSDQSLHEEAMDKAIAAIKHACGPSGFDLGTACRVYHTHMIEGITTTKDEIKQPNDESSK